MASSVDIGIILAVVFVFLVCVFLYLSIYIVHQGTGIVMERLGKFKEVLQPGFNYALPFIDSPRNFTWKKTYLDTLGTVQDTETTSNIIDLRESVYNFVNLEVYTKAPDTILVSVDSVMYFQIVDCMKAVYQIDDLSSALQNTVQTQLKEVFGNMMFQEALQSQNQINQFLHSRFSNLFGDWGIKVLRIELIGLQPAGSEESTIKNMKNQMVAERNRRGAFIKAEGEKARLNLEAEGSKQSQRIDGMAEQEALRTRSTGNAEATVIKAQAQKNALEMVAMLNGGTEYLIAQKYLSVMDQMYALEDQTFYFPYDPFIAQGCLKNLSYCFGSKSQPYSSSHSSKKDDSKRSKDMFSELN